MQESKWAVTGKCILTGAAAGVANGLFGAGGGLVLVPLFLNLLKLSPQKAMPTSVAVILPMSLLSAFAYDIQVEVQTLLPFLLGGLVGGFAGGILFPKVSVVWLRRGFGLVLLYSGIRAILCL